MTSVHVDPDLSCYPRDMPEMQNGHDPSLALRHTSTVHRRPSPIPPTRSAPEEDPSVLTPRSTPLPLLKIMPLLLARLAEGVTFTVIFPYVNSMLLSFGVREQDLGFYAGIVESALMIAEATSAPLYAPLADKVGRRPVIVVLLFCWTVGGFAFGLCTSVWGVIATRAWLGLLAGCGVLSRTMIGELCNKSNRIEGFAVFTPALTVGMTLGPLIGGLLAEPVPRILPPSFTTFVAHPYLLPAMVAAGITAIAAITAVFFLSETLDRQSRSEGSSGGIKQLMRYKPFQTVVLLYSLNNGVMFSWEAIYPLFLYTRPELGGIGLQIHEIGIILALAAMLSIFMTAFVFPRMHRRIPDQYFLSMCLIAYPLGVVFFPLIWAASREGLGPMGYILMSLQMILRRTGDFASTLLDTVVLDAIPGPEHLAMANSLTFSMASIARAIGPFTISWCFAVSTTFSLPWRFLVWFAFLAASIPSVLLSRSMRIEEDTPVDAEERHELISRR